MGRRVKGKEICIKKVERPLTKQMIIISVLEHDTSGVVKEEARVYVFSMPHVPQVHHKLKLQYVY